MLINPYRWEKEDEEMKECPQLGFLGVGQKAIIDCHVWMQQESDSWRDF